MQPADTGRHKRGKLKVCGGRADTREPPAPFSINLKLLRKLRESSSPPTLTPPGRTTAARHGGARHHERELASWLLCPLEILAAWSASGRPVPQHFTGDLSSFVHFSISPWCSWDPPCPHTNLKPQDATPSPTQERRVKILILPDLFQPYHHWKPHSFFFLFFLLASSTYSLDD